MNQSQQHGFHIRHPDFRETSLLGNVEPSPFVTAAQTVAFATIFASSILWTRNTSTRFAAVALLGSLTYAWQHSLVAWYTNLGLRSMFVDAAWITFLHAAELLVITKATGADVVGTNRKDDSIILRFLTCVSLLCKWRRIGTKWEIKDLPKHRTSAPTRLHSALQSLLGIVLAVLVMDFYTSGSPPDADMIMPGKEALLTRLSDVTATELAYRAVGTPMFLMTPIAGVLLFYNLICLVVVLTGLSEPSECPPLFGSIKNAYSIRQYWSKFYHQCLRKPVSGPADYIVDRIFLLRRGTLLSRYSRLLLAFALSGFIHHMGEIATGISAQESGQFVFFTAQAASIMIEDAVMEVYRRSGLRLSRRLEYALGYLWSSFVTAGDAARFDILTEKDGTWGLRETHFIGNPLVKAGKSGPPLHIHLAQDEYFKVESGILTASLNEKIHKLTKDDGVLCIKAGTRHRFWSDESSTESLVFHGWADPRDAGLDNVLDENFLRNLQGYMADCHREGLEPSIFQLALFSYEASTLGTPPFWLPLWMLIAANHVTARWVAQKFLGCSSYKPAYPEYSVKPRSE
ncbi:hypothetical protein G7054_g1800 [Neopestalotiopsis clavispora]|nr:hypothetical protein G7054_g1800 [Neopestalotiopsis clavispora]